MTVDVTDDVRCRLPECELPVRRNINGWSLGYCDGHLGNRGSGRYREIGDVWMDKDGYLLTKTVRGTVAQHRHLMELHLDRRLVRGESVHHKNGRRNDNRLENLELWFRGQPAGQRVEDLLAYVVEHHADELLRLLAERH
jgi:hypothetical protein